MEEHFAMMARYNVWANNLLYDAAFAVPDDDYRRDLQVAFSSLHGTLNHIIVGDRVWLSRFTGRNTAPSALDAVISDDKAELRRQRDITDAAIADFVRGADVAGTFTYERAGQSFTQTLAPALIHLFNHQTHHRGQCHAMLTRLTGEAPSLDLIYYQRETGEGVVGPH